VAEAVTHLLGTDSQERVEGVLVFAPVEPAQGDAPALIRERPAGRDEGLGELVEKVGFLAAAPRAAAEIRRKREVTRCMGRLG
jgi:hypothetical protein